MKSLNEKGALLDAPIPRLPMRTAYRALQRLQAPFGFVFWKIEQVKSWLADWIENETGEQ
jgi:hypothetical protein